MRLRKDAQAPRRQPRPPRNSVPHVSVTRRDRHKETYKPEMNPPRQITAPTPRERTIGDLDPRRNRNATSRKPSCLAHRRQTAGVSEHKTPRGNRKDRRDRTQDIPREPHARHKTSIPPQENPTAAQNIPRAHNPLCRSYNRRDATPRRPAIHDPMKRNNAASRQRGEALSIGTGSAQSKT